MVERSIAALTVMLLAAFRVRDASAAPALVATAFATVISPTCPPVVPVLISTLVPPFNALVMVTGAIVALSVEGVKTPPVSVPVPPVWMVTFLGSKSHFPAEPDIAEALANP